MIQDEYIELLSLTKRYLLQESATQPWIPSDAQTYTYFKKLAQQQIPKQKPQTILPTVKQVEQRPPPKPIVPVAKAPIADVPPPKPIPPLPVASTKSSPDVIHTPFQLIPLPALQETDLQEMRRIVTERFPSLTILDTPDDMKAKQNPNNQRNASVILLAFNRHPQQLEFLENLAKAINNKLTSATILFADEIEQQDGWKTILQSKSLRLIIANVHSMQAFPGLMEHYKEVPKQSKCYLGRVPLQLLSDLPLYFKEPQLKIGLWKMLCSTLAQ